MEESGKCSEKKLLSPSLWHRVYCGRLQDVKVPIHLKESEAALFVAKHLVRGKNDRHGKRHLILGDSMTLSYVLGKGRASNPQLLAIARKWACISMSGDLMLVYRWIPSEYNVADRDSRRWEENHILFETVDTTCSSDLKPMIGELDALLCPLVEDASPWIEFCSQQIPQDVEAKAKEAKRPGNSDSQACPVGKRRHMEKYEWPEERWRREDQSLCGIPANRTMFTRYSRLGDLDMPRTVKALNGWTRLTPPLSRWPLPWTMLAAALVILWCGRKPMVATAIALTYVAYLRPGELVTLRVRNLVAQNRPGTKGATGRFSLFIREEESGIPSKTRTFDDSVILDRLGLLWMDRLWQALIVGRPGHADLIPKDQNEIALKTIFEELGCSKLGVVAYSLRHGGPSCDFMKKFRNLDEIQQLGWWRSPTSVLRYQKASKLLSADIVKTTSSASSPSPWEVDLSLDCTSMFH